MLYLNDGRARRYAECGGEGGETTSRERGIVSREISIEAASQRDLCTFAPSQLSDPSPLFLPPSQEALKIHRHI